MKYRHTLKTNLLMFSELELALSLKQLECVKDQSLVHELRILHETAQLKEIHTKTCANNYKQNQYQRYTSNDAFEVCSEEGFPYRPCESESQARGTYCKRKSDHIQMWRHQYAGKLCIPTILPPLSSVQRYGYTIVLVNDARFHFNLSFTHFAFGVHITCQADFVHVGGSQSNSGPHFVFCGKRHPWTMFYTAHTVSIQTIAKKKSNFSLHFQMIDSTLFQNFTMCQFLDCLDTYSCEVESLPFQTNGIEKGAYVNIVEFESSRFDIFFVITHKFKFLHITERTKYAIHSIWDGPTMTSPSVHTFLSLKGFKLSTFQATLAVCQTHDLGKNKTSAAILYFNSILKNSTIEQEYKDRNFELKNRCFASNCAIFDTNWIKQPKHSFYNVNVDFLAYDGPLESRDRYFYGGVAVYFIYAKTEGEIANTCHNTSTNKAKRQKKQYPIISNEKTEFIVIVYYYYSQYSYLEAKLTVLTTKCVGYQVQLNEPMEMWPSSHIRKLCIHKANCSARHLLSENYQFLTQDEQEIIVNPPQKHCIVVSLYFNLDTPCLHKHVCRNKTLNRHPNFYILARNYEIKENLFHMVGKRQISNFCVQLGSVEH